MSRKVFAKLLHVILFAASVVVCNAQSKATVRTTGHFAVNKATRTILDLRLELVILSNIRMERALVELAEGIASSTNGKTQFALITENSRDPMDKVPKRDPKVRFEGQNVTLRQVLDSLCKQSGWSYAKVAPGYLFTDSDRLFKKGQTH